MDHDGSSFVSGFAVNAQLLLSAKMRDEETDRGDLASNFFVMNGDDWGILPETAPWAAQALAVLEPVLGGRRLLVGVGPRGELWEARTKPYDGGLGRLAEGVVLVRNLSVVEGAVYAVGLARAVYRRGFDTPWEAIGPGGPGPDEGVVGFTDLTGPSARELYAVGLGGELQRCVDGAWSRLDSPVTQHLRAACTAPDGSVYAVGYDGAMVHGRGERWRRLDTGRAEVLHDVVCHDGAVYVSTDFALLELRGEALVPVERFADPDDRPSTCLHLLPAVDGGLFSMGPKDLFRLGPEGWSRLV